MNGRPRIRPFPVASLRRFEHSDLEMPRASGHRHWLPEVCACACGLARRLGLGAARLEVVRVQALRVEDLREVFPGRWRFAFMRDPLGERAGFLVLDPVLLGRVLARVLPDMPVQAGWTLAVDGQDGVVGWLLASALTELSAREPEGFGSWRFAGLLESAGEVGRSCRGEDSLVATWLAVEAGWDRGFAVWIQTASSVRRRGSAGGDAGSDLERVAEMKLSLPVLAGTSVLTGRELLGFQAGDVILLNGCGGAGETTLRLGSLSVRGKRRGARLIVESIQIDSGGAGMNTGEIITNTGSPALDATDVGALPVEITVEAGRVELTVSQVAALTAGDVVTLPGAVLGPVELRAGSALLARGELVDVDGRRGVRVLEVSARFGGRDEDA
jgi:flagellar motor switch/type III secretory pathway protein FliN